MPDAMVTIYTPEQARHRREEILHRLRDDHGLTEDRARTLAARYELDESEARAFLHELDDLTYLLGDSDA